MQEIDSPEKAKDIGNAAYKAGDFKNLTYRCTVQRAVGYYSRAIDLSPIDDEDHKKIYFSNRSAAFAALKQFEEALQDATKCTELDPYWAKGWYRKGLAQVALERYREAEESYRRGVDYAPRDDDLQRALQEVKMMM